MVDSLVAWDQGFRVYGCESGVPISVPTQEATGNTFEPELDPFLPFVSELGHFSPDTRD